MLKVMYIGACNNAVHTVLTQDAFTALVSLRNSGTHMDDSPEMAACIMRGTFAFVDESVYPHYRGYVSGTLQDLDVLSQNVYMVADQTISNTVPFSIIAGPEHFEKELRWVRSLCEVLEAFGLLPQPTSDVASTEDIDYSSELRLMFGA